MSAFIKIFIVALITLISGAPFGIAQRPFPEVPESETNPESMHLWRTTLEPVPQAPDYDNPKAWALNPQLNPSQRLKEPKGFSLQVKLR